MEVGPTNRLILHRSLGIKFGTKQIKGSANLKVLYYLDYSCHHYSQIEHLAVGPSDCMILLVPSLSGSQAGTLL